MIKIIRHSTCCVGKIWLTFLLAVDKAFVTNFDLKVNLTVKKVISQSSSAQYNILKNLN